MVEINGLTAKAGTAQMLYYDQVVAFLREASYTYTPEWEEVMKEMRAGKDPRIVAQEYMEKWDVD